MCEATCTIQGSQQADKRKQALNTHTQNHTGTHQLGRAPCNCVSRQRRGCGPGKSFLKTLWSISHDYAGSRSFRKENPSILRPWNLGVAPLMPGYFICLSCKGLHPLGQWLTLLII